MPKINSTGVPSYDGHTGEVTNAVGEQFEVNPSLDRVGERPDDYENKPVEQFEESPAPGVAGPIVPVSGDEDEQGDDTQPVDEPKGSPKKATPPSASKQSAGVDAQKK